MSRKLNIEREAELLKMIEKRFPSIYQWMGKTWLSGKLSAPTGHPLVVSLATERDNRRKIREVREILQETSDLRRKVACVVALSQLGYSVDLAFHVERCLRIIKDKKGARKTINKLLDESQFLSALSEVEVSALFGQRYSIVLNPKVGRCELELKANISNREIYIEVFAASPRFTQGVYSVDIGKRLTDVIIGETKHLKDIPEGTPVLLVVNKGTSEIDEIHLQAALRGRPFYGLTIRKDTGEVVSEGVGWKKEEAVGSYSEQAKKFSGVIVYRQVLGRDKIILQGEVLPMPDSSAPFTDIEIRVLKDLFSGKSINEK